MRWIAVLVLASSVACSESSLPTQPTPGPVTPLLVPGSGTLFLSVVPDSPESRPRVEVFYEGFDNGALQITTQRSVQVIVHAAVAPASFELITSFKR
jgi:hypothetical protein